MTENYAELKKLVAESKTAIIAAHIDPDGDTLGSMLAMGMILEELGLNVILYSADGVPNTYKFMAGTESVVSNPPKKEFDLLVAVDASDICRIGKHNISAKKTVNIDHHPDNTNFGDVNYVELLSSVGELVYKIALEFNLKITPEMAVALYVSIITDTGNFRYSNTLPSTFKVAEALTELGANPFQIANKIYDSKSIESLKICAATISRLEHTPDKRVVWASITKDMIEETHAKSEDLVGIIDHLRSVRECEVALLFREDKNGVIKVNFRSKGKVNVSKIANLLGGGGHVQAAGCHLEMPLEEAQKKVLDAVSKEM